MRCPHCNATNPADARWCNQCLTLTEAARTDVPARESKDRPGAAAPDEEARQPGRGRPRAAAPVPASHEWEHAEGFRRRGELIERRCARCGAFFDVGLSRCDVCGAPVEAAAATGAAQHAGPTALALSALLPGAGHLAVGRYGAGLARVFLAALWLIGAVLLLGAGGRDALLGVVPLLLGLAVLWAGSLVELLALAGGREREVLSGRSLLWLVVAVTLGAAGGMAVAALGALRG